MSASNKNRSFIYTPWTGTKPYCTIPDRLAELANSRPDEEALVIIGDTDRVAVTYKEILENARVYALKLLNLGIHQRDVIAIHDDNSPEWLYSTVGAQMCGAWPFHFYFERNDGEDVIDILKMAKCKAIICQPGEGEVYVKILKHFVTFDEDGSISSKMITSLKDVIFTEKPASIAEALVLKNLTTPFQDTILPEIEPEGVASILGSSGSTGKPKLIPQSHLELILLSMSRVETGGFKAGDTYFNDRIFSWIGGYPLEMLNGIKRVTTAKFFRRSLRETCQDTLRIIQEEECDHATLFSSTIDEMIKIPVTTKRITTITTGGGPISKRDAILLEGYCNRFIIGYGCTETGIAAINVLTKPEQMLNYDVGIPAPGTDIKIVDINGAVLEKGKMGEIYVRSMYASSGYLEKEQDWHKENIAPGNWFKTGDAGFITEMGHLCVPGRMADSIIIEGRIMAPSYFEDIFKRHPCVENAVAFAIPDKRLHQIPGVAVEFRRDASVTKDTLREFFIEQRNVYMEGGFHESKVIPKHIVIFDSLPKLANGKIARKDVKEKALMMIS